MGELSRTWKAHLYVKKMRLRDDKFSLLLTASLGEYTLEAFKKAVLSTFPSVHAIKPQQNDRGSGGRDWYSRQGNKNGGKWTDRNRPGNRDHNKDKAHRAHECHPEDENAPSDAQEDDSHDGDEDSHGDDEAAPDPADGSEAGSLPEELRVGGREAEAFVTQAKKQRSEIEKARGFYQKRQSS